MAKVLHAADFHLDSAFRSLPEEQARLRRQESRELPGRLVDWANDHGAQLMLLAGDLFDSDRLFSQTAQMLAQALARFRGTVVIAPGNHDWLSAASPYRQPIWPDNVHIFLGRGMERLPLPELQCTVYGAAFTAPEEAESGLRGFYAQPDGSARIMVLHGDVGSREGRYRPIAPEGIASTGLDYLALGHVHAPSAMNRAGSTVWAYPGCPEGRGFDELGEKGFYAGVLEDSGAVSLTFVPFAGRKYEILEVNVTGQDPRAAIEAALPLDTSRDLYRIILTGETGEGGVSLEALQETLADQFYALELRDQTRLAEDLWARAEEDSLRGLFLKDLKTQLNCTGTEEERRRITMAARFGLAALDHRDLG